MDRLRLDLRHAITRLARERGFAAVAILTLGLGIGANTALFSLVQTVLVRPLPYADPGRLAMIWNADEPGDTTWLSVREVMAYTEEAQAFERLAAWTGADANFTGGEGPERVRVGLATGNLFETLGVGALHGRTLVPADSDPGADPVVVLGHGLWQRRFAGRADAVGQMVPMNGRAVRVAGVLPAGVRVPLDYRAERPIEAWSPLTVDRANLGDWGNRSYIAVGRLRDGVRPDEASAELGVIGRRWIQAGFVADQGDDRYARRAIPVQTFVSGHVRTPLLVLFGAVGFVLLIACANVANLLLARADVRRREVALRAALGAGRARIVRQLLTESVVLALAGGACGLAVAWTGARLLAMLRPVNLPRVEEMALDLPVLLFALALAVVTGLVFGLAPAVQLARADLAETLKEGGRSGTAGRARHLVRQGLVVAQMAVSVLLVVGAGLLVRSLVELQRIDLGFQAGGVVTARVALPATDYPDADAVVRFYQDLDARLAGLPGVEAVGAARQLPLSGTMGDWSITIEGRPYVAEENPNGDWQVVTPGYFEAMQLSLVRGRVFTAADRGAAPGVVVINETMAKRYWPGEDALGKRFHLGTADQPWMTVVGVTRDVRHNDVTETARAEMYVPHAQFPAQTGFAPRSMALAVRTAGSPLALAPAVRDTVRAIDPNLPVSDIRTMEQVAADALAQPRFTALLLGLFAALALTLAAVGIYGTLALLAAERAQEIGIRLALGAPRGRILGMVLGQGLVVAGGGIVLGLAGAAALAQVLDSLVYGIGTRDPLTFGVVPLLLGLVALVAALVPARRAAAVDPMVTLRSP